LILHTNWGIPRMGRLRITTLGFVGEGKRYLLPSFKRSHQIWKEIESLSGKKALNLPTGGILMDQVFLLGKNMGTKSFFKIKRFPLLRIWNAYIKWINAAEHIAPFPPIFCPRIDRKTYAERSYGIFAAPSMHCNQLELAIELGADVLVTTPKVLGLENS